mmetsp:Transcript_28362/g.67252  ORF Transcript_28362/g.67252 Transcript_28362/m.67252 type:complete len:504 (+) Transcript_28362:53-1564(+)
MVSVKQLLTTVLRTVFILILSFNFLRGSRNATMKEFLVCLNRNNFISVSIFLCFSRMIFSEFFSFWNRLVLNYFPNFSISKVFLGFFFSIIGNSYIIQGFKNVIIECAVIVLFNRRQFSIQSSLKFSSFMLFRAFHEPWVEKFRIIKRNSEDFSLFGRFFYLLFIGILVHFESLLSKIFLDFHRFRTVNIIVGFEIIFLSYSLKGYLIDQIFSLANDLFLNGNWLAEDTCALYLRFVVFFVGGISYKNGLNCLDISDKALFKYYLLRRSFQCSKWYIESLEESSRYRKTTVSVGSLLRNPTIEEIEKLDIKACVICRGEMVPTFSKILPCGHVYHIRCLQNWVRRQYCCPTCLFPISPGSLYSVKKTLDFLNQSFEKKNVNIIAATIGLTKDTEIYSRNPQTFDKSNSLPTLNPDLTSILFRNLSPVNFQKKISEKPNKIDFYLELLERVEKARKTILKDFYLISENENQSSFTGKKESSGWTQTKPSSVISRIQGTLVRMEN